MIFTTETVNTMAKVTDEDTMTQYMMFVNEPEVEGLTPAEAFQTLQHSRRVYDTFAEERQAAWEALEATQYDNAV